MKNVRTITWIGLALSLLAFALIPYVPPAALCVAVAGIVVSVYARATAK